MLFLDFQVIDKDMFENRAIFSQAIARLILDLHKFEDVSIPKKIIAVLENLNISDTTRVK